MAYVGPKVMESLFQLASHGIDTLITGTHGIGKTEMVMSIAKRLGLKVKYYSASTLDPWADLVGIPTPVKEVETFRIVRSLVETNVRLATRFLMESQRLSQDLAEEIVDHIHIKSNGKSHLEFLRPEDLQHCDWVVCDEINRSHERVQNAILELVQFKTINGEHLPRLQMVWGIQNPPGGTYRVTPLDPALVDRFGAHVHLEGKPSLEYYIQSGVNKDTAQAVVSWYETDCNEDQKALLTPRTLHHVMQLVDKGMEPGFCLLDRLAVPLQMLRNRINSVVTSQRYSHLTLADVIAKENKYIDLAENDPDFCVWFVHQLGVKGLRSITVLRLVRIISALPTEYQAKVFSHRELVSRIVHMYRTVPSKIPSHILNSSHFNDFIENAKVVALPWALQ